MASIMEESLLRWTLNGSMQEPVLCSPGREDLMITGYLLTSGLISALPEVISLTPGPVWNVQTAFPTESRPLSPLTSSFTISLAACTERYEDFLRSGKSTGQHCMLLMDSAQKAIGRDISRHNALDRAVGAALLSGMDFSACTLLTSGRITLSFLEKAAGAGIPVIITGKQVGSLSIQRARELNISIVQLGKTPSVLGGTMRISESAS